jgi:hypothetical protein
MFASLTPGYYLLPLPGLRCKNHVGPGFSPGNNAEGVAFAFYSSLLINPKRETGNLFPARFVL